MVLIVRTDVTIGVFDLNRCCDRCSRLQPTIGVVDLWPCYQRYYRYSQFLTPFYLLMLIVRSNSRMLVVFFHKTVSSRLKGKSELGTIKIVSVSNW